ncbi:hypothetical protein BKA62DRAFT_692204 [Auriculariales sp. MPI-PUGE-AT-0066]|nr:hypothetical protein BKA62DRAFT_692204 [Auriculariales sp. MPI-PUGE-AT-0066]
MASTAEAATTGWEQDVKPVLEQYWPHPTPTELKQPSKPAASAYISAYNKIYDICCHHNHEDSAKLVMPPLEMIVEDWITAARAYIEAEGESKVLERYLETWTVFQVARSLTSHVYRYPDRHLFPQWEDGGTRLPTDYARQPVERHIPSDAVPLRRWRLGIYEPILNNDNGVAILKAAIPADDTVKKKEVKDILHACSAQYGEAPIDSLK